MKVWIGIDPGFSGAVAAILEDGRTIVHDTPVLPVGTRHEYDTGQMAAVLDDVASPSDAMSASGTYQVVCVLERGGARPMEGRSSVYKTGRGVGLWEGLLAGKRVPYELVTPQRWRKVMLDGMPKGAKKKERKGASILRAKQLFPQAELTLRKHHGRADALLMAEYARRLRP